MNTGLVQTVLGVVPADSLGVTHAHEHLVAYATEKIRSEEPDLLLDDPNRVAVDLEEFRRLGGGCIVEMTTVDYGHDPLALRALSDLTGVKIIAVTGFNKEVYCKAYCEGKDPGEIAAREVADIVEGIAGTGVRAGAIKFATSLNAIRPAEEVAARAAARAHLETGVPILTHTEAGTMAHEQLDLLASEGVPADRVVIGHMDRNPDLDLHRSLILRGAYISYDQVPKPKYATEGHVIRLITALAKEGLHDHIVVGGDFARRSLFAGWGGSPGLRYLTTTFVGKLRQALGEAGLDADEVVEAILVRNPARALAIRA